MQELGKQGSVELGWFVLVLIASVGGNVLQRLQRRYQLFV